MYIYMSNRQNGKYNLLEVNKTNKDYFQNIQKNKMTLSSHYELVLMVQRNVHETFHKMTSFQQELLYKQIN